MTALADHNRQKAIDLLGKGLPNKVVAAALGVTDSVISQYLAEPRFAEEVRVRRCEILETSADLDTRYDGLESKLLEKLESSLSLITRPRDVLNAIKVINGANRKGTSLPENSDPLGKVVTLTIPQVVQQRFNININNQVTEVQDGEGNSNPLVTADAASIQKLADKFASQAPKIGKLPSPAPARLTTSRKPKSTITAADL